MTSTMRRRPRLAGGKLLPVSALLVCCALVQPAPARWPPPPPPPTPQQQGPPPVVGQPPADEADEVLRVETELVQTAVTVVDKQGRFVGGLRREQFELLIDGKPQPISFFEQVTAGTAAERRQLAAAGGTAGATATPAEFVAETNERGRTVFLFVDDLHLGTSGYGLARKSLRRYLDAVMGQNDQAAVVSASGQLGFLQQLTDDKAVLRAVVERLNFRPPSLGLTGRPPITAYQAIAVQERNDSLIFEYLVDETLRSTPGLPRSVAESLVQSRTRVITQDAAHTTKATLSALENLLRSSAARLPGRKIVLFFSDGFLFQMQNTDEAEQLRRLTDAAARSGAVVYAVDSRGLATDPYFDASRGTPVDPTGRGMTVAHSTAELRAQQDPLRTISEETGGRAVVNTNDLAAGMERVLDESSRYYLLAWRPERDDNRGGKFRRVEVAVAGRPDLSARLHRGYFAPGASPAPKAARPTAATTPQDGLRAELSAVFPSRQLPVALAVNFVDLPDRGAVLTAATAVPSYPLAFKSAGGKRTAAVDVACVVFDDKGKPAANAQESLIVSDSSDAAATDAGLLQRDVAYNFQFNGLPPGLYQVRAAARDGESGRVGSASRWIEIPDLKKRKLALSSLLVGSLPGVAQGAGGGRAGPERLNFDAAQKFARASRLGVYTYVYNAARGDGGRAAPDLFVRVRVLHGDRAVIDSGERRISTDGAADPARLAYGADLDLSSLAPGCYLLEVGVTDRHTKQAASQSSRFEIR